MIQQKPIKLGITQVAETNPRAKEPIQKTLSTAACSARSKPAGSLSGSMASRENESCCLLCS